MSRYTKFFDNLEYAYGYDRQLGDYFFEKFDTNQCSKRNDQGCVFAIASHASMNPHPDTPSKRSYSKGEILDIIEQEEKTLGKPILDKEHKLAMAVDLPF